MHSSSLVPWPTTHGTCMSTTAYATGLPPTQSQISLDCGSPNPTDQVVRICGVTTTTPVTSQTDFSCLRTATPIAEEEQEASLHTAMTMEGVHRTRGVP